MIGTNLALLTLTGALLLAPAAPANEKAVPAGEKVYVYGGGCSRSIQLQGTYDHAWQACEAAEKLRTKDKLRYVTVRTGAHEKDYFGTNATQYKVYRNRCKLNWQLQATFDSPEKAKDLADSLKKAGDGVEVVLHYAPRG